MKNNSSELEKQILQFIEEKQKRGCEKTRLSFFASPFLHLLCIND